MRSLLIACLLVACGPVEGNTPPGDDAPDDAPPGIDAPDEPAPAVTSIAPDWGSTSGGTRITIRGTNFVAAGLTVTFGATPGTNAVLVSDTEMTVITPAGPHSPVTVELVTANGNADGPQFRYLAPLYAADGRGGTPGNLYTVNAANAVTTTIGAIGFALTGMSISPDGRLFGIGKTAGGAQQVLVSVDPYSGAGTQIAPLTIAGGGTFGASDATFHGAELLAWRAKGMARLDLVTGVATLLPDTIPAATATSGCGFASNGADVRVAPTRANGSLFTVNPATGVATAGPTMNGAAVSVSAMTFVGAALFASVNTNMTVAALVQINLAAGAHLRVGDFPAGTRIDALAGIP